MTYLNAGPCLASREGPSPQSSRGRARFPPTDHAEAAQQGGLGKEVSVNGEGLVLTAYSGGLPPADHTEAAQCGEVGEQLINKVNQELC
jgi:hypothetical protein